MCGIAGIVVSSKNGLSNEQKKILEQDIHSMTDVISHRGKDSGNYFIDDNGQCFLGHRRLSIIDLSEQASQPMTSFDGRFQIIFNGEIYNYNEIAEELKSFGIKFSTQSDTEVLLQAYIKWGKDCLNKLRGMFSFAIWDSLNKKLFAARDHLGKKPFYWFCGQADFGKIFAFSSELKSFSKLSFYKKELNLDAVDEYLSFYSINSPDTFFKNIFSLEPAHFLQYCDENLITQRFWDLRDINLNDSLNFDEIKDRTKNILEESVRLRMRADVSVGAFLSGGFDSATIVGLMSNLTNLPVKTFSIGFEKEGDYINELSLAAMVAKKFGCDHRGFIVTGEQFRKAFDNFIYYIDQPSGDGVNGFLISQFASQHVKVALSGLGGDEVFLGYKYFEDLLKLKTFNNKLGFFLAYLFKYNKYFRSFAYRYNLQFLRFYGLKDKDIYLQMRSLFLNDEKNLLVNNKSILKNRYLEKASVLLDKIFDLDSLYDQLNAFSKAELSWYTPGMLLKDSDVTAMAFTLEVRVPFLDKQLVEFLLSVSGKHKTYLGQKYNKPLLVDLFEDLLPKELLNFPKHGFEMPVGFWIIKYFQKELKELENLSWLNKSYVEKLICDFKRNPKNYLRVWSLIVLNKWLQSNNFEIS